MTVQYTEQEKRTLGKMLLSAYEHSGMTQSRYALSVGLVKSDISNLKLEKWLKNPRLIGEKKWVRIARLVNYEKRTVMQWNTAQIEVFEFVTAQLTNLQAFSMASILVDAPGIGKTYAAKEFARQNRNAFYLNCSAVPTKRGFMRAFCKMVGVDDVGSLDSQLGEALYMLSQLDRPVIILDEAGDLDNSCMLLLKRIYNELEGVCGFYLIGSDGLKKKIERGIRSRVQGYTELFSRLGNKFSSVYRVEDGVDAVERRRRMQKMAVEICVANGITDKENQRLLQEMFRTRAVCDLRGVARVVVKLKNPSETPQLAVN